MNYGEMNAALIAGLITGRLVAARGETGELLFHAAGNVAENALTNIVEVSEAVREIEATCAVQDEAHMHVN